MTTDNELPTPTGKAAKKREQNAEYRRRAKERREADPQLREAWLQRKREETKRYVAKKKQQEQHRRREVDRVKAWVEANPERAAETRRRWAENNPEKIRAAQLAYYYRHRGTRLEAMRDRDAAHRADPAQREKQRRYVAQHREHLNALQRARRSTPEGQEKHRVEQREWRQRERRRKQLGLPPRARHRATTNERSRNAAAAEAFFSRRRARYEIDRLFVERIAPGRIERANSNADDRARRETAKRVDIDRAENERIGVLMGSIAGERVREEIRMDSIARQLRGLAPYTDVDLEARRRLRLLITEGITDDSPRCSSLGRCERLR